MASEIVPISGVAPANLDGILLELAQACMWPVMGLILIAFAFALMSVGGFLLELYLRWRSPKRILHFSIDEGQSIEQMELTILKELEGLRLCSRVSPMLGLVATMIPLGPALVAVASSQSGRSQSVMTELATAFSAVIISLIAASITFAVHTIRRRWLLWEMTQVLEEKAK